MRSNAKKVFQKLQAKFEKVKQEAPKVLANEGQKVFNENFAKKSYDNQKWPDVKRRQPGTFEYKYPKTKYLARRTNPILVGKTRRLKNAVNRSVNWGRTNINRIVWGVYSVDYAIYHNEGRGQKKRKFMGINKTLTKRLKMKFEQLYRSNLK